MRTIQQHPTEATAGIWGQFGCIVEYLDAEDDRAFWELAVRQIIADAEFLAAQNKDKKTAIFAQVGRCSHWLRPHQTRWVADADGGFAAPIGYGGSGYSRYGLPEFDWSLNWQWEPETGHWVPTDKPLGKRQLKFRVAIPSRTKRHDQAAVHTIWTPGAPTTPDKKAVQFYGFRKQDSVWQLTAHWSRFGVPYDVETAG